ncbi:MAG: T9SS type A sorting domain-containing protein, partial [Candidatus Delongbacteria bacterium]|nr:T9SS type A sorting domain-containing protein [Candidatus Delongbacteria bacterium]
SIVIRHTNSTGDDVNNSPIDIEITDYRTFSRTLEMIDGTNNINVTLIDKSGNILSEDTALIYEDPRVTNIIGESGGIVTSPDGTIVDIPAGALLSDEEITIRTISTEGLPRPRDGSGILLLKNAHEFGPENLIFHEPVTITLSYNDFDLDLDQDGNPDITEADLEVFTLDGNTWIKTVADDNDEVGNLVRFTTNHFSVYALGTQTPTTDIKVYWTKNPFSANNSTTVVAELIDNGIVSLKIYDMSGDLVRVLADQMPVAGTTNIKWDGKNDYDNYVGSGIYIYVFEYENSTTGVKETIKKPIGVIK